MSETVYLGIDLGTSRTSITSQMVFVKPFGHTLVTLKTTLPRRNLAAVTSSTVKKQFKTVWP